MQPRSLLICLEEDQAFFWEGFGGVFDSGDGNGARCARGFGSEFRWVWLRVGGGRKIREVWALVMVGAIWVGLGWELEQGVGGAQ